jgi:SAM-dependent methyltransferase
MDVSEYRLMYGLEDTHWWYQGMAAITCALLDRRYRTDGLLRILDAGCGTGAAMTSYLARYGRVWGADNAPEALRFCRRRGAAALTCASVTNLPYANGSFDLATSFDVLYEQTVSSDLDALQEIRRVLVAGGRLLLRLPAYAWMRRNHDTVVRTRQRYTRREVESLLGKSGFRIERISYANAILFPAAVLKKISERLLASSPPQSDLSIRAGVFNGILRRLLSSEAPWIVRAGLPFGLSVIGLGVKP